MDVDCLVRPLIKTTVRERRRTPFGPAHNREDCPGARPL